MANRGLTLDELERARFLADWHAERSRQPTRLRAWAIGVFDVLAGGLFALSALWFVQGSYPFALGVLGPALAALVGVVGFRLRRRAKSIRARAPHA